MCNVRRETDSGRGFDVVLSAARERIVGWYHTGPKLHRNDVVIDEFIKQYCPNSVSANTVYTHSDR